MSALYRYNCNMEPNSLYLPATHHLLMLTKWSILGKPIWFDTHPTMYKLFNRSTCQPNPLIITPVSPMTATYHTTHSQPPRLILWHMPSAVTFFFAESGVLFFLKWITCTFWSELHVHFAGCHIVLLVLSGEGGEDEKVNLKLKIVWCEYLWVATSPCRGFGGPPPRKFINMKCSRGDSRPT